MATRGQEVEAEAGIMAVLEDMAMQLEVEVRRTVDRHAPCLQMSRECEVATAQ